MVALVSNDVTYNNLVKYCEFRRNRRRDVLEGAQDVPTLYKSQGAVEELVRILNMRNHIEGSKE